MSLLTAAVALLGAVGIPALFAYVLRDARRVGVSHPRAWALFAAGSLAVGLGTYLFVPTAPTTGVIMTANTGLVLYGFEREVTQRGDESASPRELPGGPTGDGTDASGGSSRDEGGR